MKKALIILMAVTLLMVVTLGLACDSDGESPLEDGGELNGESPLEDGGEVTGNTYTSSEYGFSIDYPEGWDVEEDYLGAAVAFLGPDVEYGAYMVNITVVVEEMGFPYTLDDYVRASKVQLSRMHPSAQFIEEGSTTIGGEAAYVWVLTAHLDEYDITIKDKQMIIVKGATAFVVTYDTTEGAHSDYLDHANMAIQSFKLD